MCWCMFQPCPKLLEVLRSGTPPLVSLAHMLAIVLVYIGSCFCLHAVWNRSPLRSTFGFTSISSSRFLALILVFRESTCKVPLVIFPTLWQLFQSRLCPYLHFHIEEGSLHLSRFSGSLFARAIFYGRFHTSSLGRQFYFDRWGVILSYITVGTSMPDFLMWVAPNSIQGRYFGCYSLFKVGSIVGMVPLSWMSVVASPMLYINPRMVALRCIRAFLGARNDTSFFLGIGAYTL